MLSCCFNVRLMAGVAINYVDTINEFHQDHENDENPIVRLKLRNLPTSKLSIHVVTKTQYSKNVYKNM